MILREYNEHGTIGRNGWYVQYIVANLRKQIAKLQDMDLYHWLYETFDHVEFRYIDYRQIDLDIISIRVKDRKELTPSATRTETPDQIHQDQGQVQDGI